MSIFTRFRDIINSNINAIFVSSRKNFQPPEKKNVF